MKVKEVAEFLKVTTDELLKLLKKYHVSRLSIGIQTLNESFQHHINREFDYEKLSTVVKMLNECGFINYSFDLMYGFLNQTISDIKFDIDKLVSLNPTHISIYSLIVEDHTIFGKLKNDGHILESTDEEQAKEIDRIQKEMEEKAAKLGANAIVGVSYGYETMGQGGSMLMIAISGTAVIID